MERVVLYPCRFSESTNVRVDLHSLVTKASMVSHNEKV
jgi:hypothetical protein